MLGWLLATIVESAIRWGRLAICSVRSDATIIWMLLTSCSSDSYNEGVSHTHKTAFCSIRATLYLRHTPVVPNGDGYQFYRPAVEQAKGTYSKEAILVLGCGLDWKS